jgi:hypothetical protein
LGKSLCVYNRPVKGDGRLKVYIFIMEYREKREFSGFSTIITSTFPLSPSILKYFFPALT